MHERASMMSAAVFTAPMQARLERVALPEPAAGCVRVRLEGCGVCGSNLAPWEGRPWFKYPLPAGEPGHEGWGRIDAVASDVANLRVGDRVALLSYRAYAEYDVAHHESVIRLP